jgi:hypothetical protein
MLLEQTSVEWLIEKIYTTDWVNYSKQEKSEVFNQAKEMEKQQQDCFYEKALFVLENSPNNINTKKQLISWFKLFKKK